MRIFYFILSFFCLCDFLNAQSVHITYEGDPLTDKEQQKIEKVLQYEVDFYAQFGLPQTLHLVLHVFNKKADALEYLEKLNVQVDKNIAGVYMSNLQKAFILGREKKKDLGIIFHELSHHFTRLITSNRSPIWLNEGLSEYFGHCKIGKKGLQHTLTDYERGRIRTMFMLGDIHLLAFINSKQDQFMKQQKTDEQYAYILSHALVTFWIDKVPREIFKNLIFSIQDRKETSTVSEQIESAYLGGFSQFEKDFTTFCNK